MCYYVSNLVTKKEMKDAFGVTYTGPKFEGSGFLNGFTHPKTPIVTNEDPESAILGAWGLVPPWAKNRDIRKSTLNARIETLADKPSFRDSVNNRCLVLVTGFYEWKWHDAKGKQKEKFFIRLNNDNRPFALGGIYNSWHDREKNETLMSFAVVTSGANDLMADIHNTKDRMPLVLTAQAAKAWLKAQPTERFEFPAYDPDLVAISV